MSTFKCLPTVSEPFCLKMLESWNEPHRERTVKTKFAFRAERPQKQPDVKKQNSAL